MDAIQIGRAVCIDLKDENEIGYTDYYNTVRTTTQIVLSSTLSYYGMGWGATYGARLGGVKGAFILGGMGGLGGAIIGDYMGGKIIDNIYTQLRHEIQ